MTRALTILLGASLCLPAPAYADAAFQTTIRSKCAAEVGALSGMYAAQSPGTEEQQVARVLALLDERTEQADMADMQGAVSAPTASTVSAQTKIGMALTRCIYGLRIVAQGATPEPMLQPAAITGLMVSCDPELKANIGGRDAPFESTEELAIATLQFLKAAPPAKLKEMNALPVGQPGDEAYGPNSLLRCATAHVMAGKN